MYCITLTFEIKGDYSELMQHLYIQDIVDCISVTVECTGSCKCITVTLKTKMRQVGQFYSSLL